MTDKLQWTKDISLGHGKMFIGFCTAKLIHECNLTAALTRCNDRSQNIIAQRVGDQMPDLMLLLEKHGGIRVRRPNGNGRTFEFDQPSLLIRSRAHACFRGELKTLITPEWSHSIEAMAKLVDDEKKVCRIYDLYDIQEKQLIVNFGNGPGVYARVDPDANWKGYIGKSKNIHHRNHKNASHKLFAIAPTNGLKSAEHLETLFHTYIQEKFHCQEERITGHITLLDRISIEEVWEKALEWNPIQNYFRANCRISSETTKAKFYWRKWMESINIMDWRYEQMYGPRS